MTVALRKDGKPLVIVAGDEFTFTFTLGGSASISGATVTASIRPVGQANVNSGLSLTVTDATNRVVTLNVSEANTALWSTNGDPRILTEHIADVKVVQGTVTVHSEDFSWWVRGAIT